MILTTLADSSRYQHLHPAFAAALTFLNRSDLAQLERGRHALDGDRLYAVVERRDAVGRSAAVLEAHRRYIDLQYTVVGAETMGWRDLASCRNPRSAFEVERDIVFFNDEPVAWVDVPPGYLAVFFPEDAHAPLAGDGPLHKVIVKAAVA